MRTPTPTRTTLIALLTATLGGFGLASSATALEWEGRGTLSVLTNSAPVPFADAPTTGLLGTPGHGRMRVDLDAAGESISALTLEVPATPLPIHSVTYAPELIDATARINPLEGFRDSRRTPDGIVTTVQHVVPGVYVQGECLAASELAWSFDTGFLYGLTEVVGVIGVQVVGGFSELEYPNVLYSSGFEEVSLDLTSLSCLQDLLTPGDYADEYVPTPLFPQPLTYTVTDTTLTISDPHRQLEDPRTRGAFETAIALPTSTPNQVVHLEVWHTDAGLLWEPTTAPVEPSPVAPDPDPTPDAWCVAMTDPEGATAADPGYQYTPDGGVEPGDCSTPDPVVEGVGAGGWTDVGPDAVGVHECVEGVEPVIGADGQGTGELQDYDTCPDPDPVPVAAPSVEDPPAELPMTGPGSLVPAGLAVGALLAGGAGLLLSRRHSL